MKKKFRKLFLLLLTFVLSISMGIVADAASVKISKKSVSLFVSQSTTLTISGTKQKAKWSSSNKKVAKVSSKGKVTAVKAGKATISAKIGKKTYSCKVTVKSGLSETKVTLDKGKTKTLKLYGGTIKSVSTSKKNVATISKSGKITAKGKGTCTVTIKDKKGKKYTCKVTVLQKVTKVKLNKTSASLNAGEKLTLKATVTPTNANNRKVKWTSSNAKAAKVTSGGVVTAVAPGTAVIKATAADGSKKSASCRVTVKRLAAEVKLDKSSASLEVGETLRLSGTVSPADASNKALTWTSSDATVATVSDGQVMANKPGTAVITAATADGSNRKAQCTVTVIRKAASISLSQTSLSLENGRTISLTATVLPSDTTNPVVTWSSSNTAVATVSNGVVTAKKAGTAVITAVTSDGTNHSAQCTVTVIQKAASISLDQTSLSLEEAQTASLRATVSPSDTTNPGVAWSSSNTAVATVNSNGLVTAVKEGTAVISAATTDGTNRTAACQVTVRFNGNVTVSSQEQLNTVFARQDINSKLVSLTLQSNAAVSLTIPQGTYANARLTVNLPNGEVINNGRFQSCVIQAISGNTFIEQTTGNTLRFQALSGRIQIASGAAAAIEVGGASGIQNLSIVNNGRISGLEVDNRANISVTGNETRNAIPVTGTVNAANSVIATSQRLNVTAESKMNLVLREGAENTTASVRNDSNTPAVSGLGSVTVTNTVTNQVDTIVAEQDPGSDVRKVTLTGIVTTEDSASAAGASVYLIPYSASIDKENISGYFSYGQKQTVNGEDGYSFAGVSLGNYYLAVTKEGYDTLTQTLVITSVASDTYSNSALCLVKSGGENGSISGVLTDALTGSRINYSVVVNVRRGQNALSGAALRTFTLPANDNGSYEIADLPAGTYTVQVLRDPNSDTVISGTSFSVTVRSGAVSNGNHTVTRELEKGQVRFVLTWGDEKSGAPSDLDSHLTGPAAAGAGRLHTWYSDKEYDYNGVRYADLDVDDTSWEGPETTTIYKEVSGIYSFYVFDFTDQEDEYSSRMSNQSQAVVKVYSDEILLATFYVPAGCSGNLWHVCDYNSNTGAVTSVNTVGYWPDGGSSTVGLSALDVLRDKLGSTIGDLENVLELLAEGSYKTALEQAVEEARSVYQNGTEETRLQAAIDSLNGYVSDVNDMPAIDSFTGTNIARYSDRGERIDLYGTAENVGEVLSVSAVCENSQVSAVYTPVSGQDYIGTVTATKESGLTRLWKVYYSFDIQMFEILGVNGEGITDYSSDSYSDRGYLYLCGTADALPDFTLTLRDGVTYEVAKNSDTEYPAVVTMRYEGHSYVYYVEYSFDNAVFAIEDVIGEDIGHYETERYPANGYLYLYGIAESLPEFTLSLRGGEAVSYQLAADPDGEYAGIIEMSYGNHTYRYYIEYRFDSETLFKIMNLSGNGVTSYDVDGNYLYVNGVGESLPELTLTVKDGVTWTMVRATGSEDLAEIHMSYGEYTYKYYVEYTQSLDIFRVNGVTGTGIVRFSCGLWSPNGELWVYGTAESLPEDITLEMGDGVAYEIQKNTDPDMDSEITVTVKHLGYEYKYNLYYVQVDIFQITSVNGDGILRSRTEMAEAYGTLDLYGFADELRITEIETEGTEVAWSLETPESGADYDAVLRLTEARSGESYVYHVYCWNTVAELETDTPYEVEISRQEGCVYFKYTAPADGTYTFASSGNDGDPFVSLYDEEGNWMNNYDDGEDLNFYLAVNMEAGRTYYFEAKCVGSGTGKYTVTLTDSNSGSEATELSETELLLKEDEADTEAVNEAETEMETEAMTENTESEPSTEAVSDEVPGTEEPESSEEFESGEPGATEIPETEEAQEAVLPETEAAEITLLPEEEASEGADWSEAADAEKGGDSGMDETEAMDMTNSDSGSGEILSMEITLDLEGTEDSLLKETASVSDPAEEEDIIEEPMF